MIKGIVCMGENRVIGNNGAMPWGDKPLDGKHFRSLTEGHIVVMGYNTFASMGFKPLPKRLNIVLSRQSLPRQKSDNLWVVGSKEEALTYYKFYTQGGTATDTRDLWVIGGAEIYRLFASEVEEWHITTVSGKIEGNVQFPDIFKKRNWKSDYTGQDEAQGHILTYRRLYEPENVTV